MKLFLSFSCLFWICFLQPSCQGLSDQEFADECLKWHNHYRNLHDAIPLVMLGFMNTQAKSIASHLAESGTESSENDMPSAIFGSNVAVFRTDRPLDSEDVKDIVKSWYIEGADYTYKNSSGTSKVLHFTQSLWNYSRTLGCQCAYGSDGKVYVVALYFPKGNIPGQFLVNVKPLNTTKSEE